MKRLSVVLVFTIALLVSVFAQKSKITTGVLALQSGKPGEAIIKFEEALAKPELIKSGKDIAKAYYNLSQAYYQAGLDSALMKTYPDALFKAADNYTLALNHPEGAGFQKQAILDNAEGNLWGALFNAGATVFNEETEGADKKALQYFTTADKISPNNFLTNRMVGTCHLVLLDTANSIVYFEKAIKIYKDKYVTATEGVEALKQTDEYKKDSEQMSFLYQQLSLIYEAQHDAGKGLALLNEGSTVLPEDKDIKRMELIIYQKHPELFAEAVSKFETAIKDNPEDANIKLAYAGLLEQSGKSDDAFKLYEEVYRMNNQDLSANYGMGAYYINKAASISEAKMKLDDEDKIEVMNKEIIALLEKAYPFMKWLHEQQPNEREWLSQLVTITPILGKDEEMMEYGKKLGELSRKAEGN
ncbi:MAG: tetratricopeptide repeat protein [Bacteroidia bacterium]|nr:tetratricopeptide repeat protein [Bacteroidia bacterium]